MLTSMFKPTITLSFFFCSLMNHCLVGHISHTLHLGVVSLKLIVRVELLKVGHAQMSFSGQ